MDECATNLCAAGALCTNFPGGFHCECPPGTTGDAYRTGCQDVNECLTNPCGVNAICKNTPGSFQCICPSGYTGDPFHLCAGKLSLRDCKSFWKFGSSIMKELYFRFSYVSVIEMTYFH